jgi:hypothetical protein
VFQTSRASDCGLRWLALFKTSIVPGVPVEIGEKSQVISDHFLEAATTAQG